MHLRNIISIGLLFASLVGSSGAWAVDCPQDSYFFTTQVEVDAFPQNCDSVLDRLTVANSTDITNIDALANLTSVGGDLYIYENAALTNLGGLANLTSVGDELYIGINTALANIDGLAKLTSVGGFLNIANNTALTNCQGIAPVLGWPNGPPADSVVGDITISRNATGCNSVDEILASYSPPAATPVPVGPIWLLGMMAGLLSLVAVRKLRKA